MPSTPIATASRRAAPLPPDERRAAIIEAVMPLLLERGAAVTSRMLAAAAGVSEGTIFNVFADKEELLAAAIERATDQGPFEAGVAAIDQGAPFVDRLVAVTDLTQRRIVDIWRLTQIEGHRPGRLPDSPALLALFTAEADRIRLEPLEAARLLRALTLALTHPMLTPEPASAAHIVDVFLDGASSEPSAGRPGR